MTPARVLLAFALFRSACAAGPDAVCAPCHRAIYESYEGTPMAQSSGEADAAHVPAGGFGEYRIAANGDVSISGTTTHRLKYFIGAGATGRSYIYDAGGYLFQSPVAFYSAVGKWDLSPGFEAGAGAGSNNAAGVILTRAVEVSCLNCHASGVEAIPHTENRYAEPAFAQAGVSCERCHGAAAAHLARVRSGSKAGPGIVNPAKLDPARRASVCEQCHLMGVARISKPGAKAYSPGDLFFDSTAVFLWTEGDRPLPANSHFEQLAQSACWRKSEGRLWCGTCHDPHRVVPASERAAYYRSRCETCHGANAPPCAESAAARTRAHEDCVRCHMTTRPAQTVQHAAQTDHAIERIPRPAEPPAGIPETAQLAPFPGSSATDRELGLAWADNALNNNELRVIALLRPVFAAHKNDAILAAQIARFLDKTGRQSESCEILSALAQSDDAPTGALVNAGTCAASGGNLPTAIALWRRALERNPGQESARLNLAVALYRTGDAAAARSALKDGLALDPFWRQAKEMLAELE